MYSQYDAFTIGFDKIFDRFKDLQAQAEKVITYPPYNIKKTGENTCVVELALAGFLDKMLKLFLKKTY